MKPRHQADLPELFGEAGADAARLIEALATLVSSETAPPELLRERLLGSVSRPRLRFAPLFGALADLFDLGDADLASLFERGARLALLAQALPQTLNQQTDARERQEANEAVCVTDEFVRVIPPRQNVHKTPAHPGTNRQ